LVIDGSKLDVNWAKPADKPLSLRKPAASHAMTMADV
jgi:hypothetical protein